MASGGHDRGARLPVRSLQPRGPVWWRQAGGSAQKGSQQDTWTQCRVDIRGDALSCRYVSSSFRYSGKGHYLHIYKGFGSYPVKMSAATHLVFRISYNGLAIMHNVTNLSTVNYFLYT